MRPLYKLGEDAYVEWSTVVDAPASSVMTYEQAFAAHGAERMVRVESQGHSWIDYNDYRSPEDLVGFNRAGPHEEQLTLAAILERYAPDAEDRPLTPADIQPGWTNWWTEEGKDADEHGPVYAWRPWRPGEAPEQMPSPDEYHQMWTRIYADELDTLRS